MIRDINVKRVEFPACGQRLMDKEIDASGRVHVKCTKSKHVWQVNLRTDEFKLISGKAIPRREGA